VKTKASFNRHINDVIWRFVNTSTSKMTREKNGVQPADVAQEGGALPKNTTFLRAVIFIAIFAVLQSLYGAAKDTWVEHLVIDQVTVKSAAWMIQVFDPSTGVQPVGSRLRAPGGGINVINGCEGTDVIFLMLGAMLVAPISMKAKLLGVFFGTALVLALNQARVIALFYAYRLDRGLFDTLHGVVAPLLLIMAAAGFFVLWLHWHSENEAKALT